MPLAKPECQDKQRHSDKHRLPDDRGFAWGSRRAADATADLAICHTDHLKVCGRIVRVGRFRYDRIHAGLRIHMCHIDHARESNALQVSRAAIAPVDAERIRPGTAAQDNRPAER